MIDVVSADTRAGVPADAEEEAELYAAQVLNNPSFDKKGPYVKMCSWFSILAAVKYHDPSWTINDTGGRRSTGRSRTGNFQEHSGD